MKMRSKVLVAITAWGLLGLSAGYAQTPPAEDPPEASLHVQKAKEIGGQDLATPAQLLCLPSRQTIAYMIADSQSHPPEAPYKVFDNLYFVGGRQVTTWAIETSQGIILIDAMNNAQDAQDYIVAGLKKMGLSPTDIKIVLLTHGHGDHYGGSVYLQDTYGARIAMSDADWKLLEALPADPVPSSNRLTWGPRPQRDITLQTDEKLTLGDTSITLIDTPGHSPGTVSVIFPVTDNGVLHHAALWGGTGQPAAGPESDQYEASLDLFAELTEAAHVDVVISNHPLVDGTIDKLTRLRANPDGPNPFVISETIYKRYLSILKECMLAARARPPQARRPAPTADTQR